MVVVAKLRRAIMIEDVGNSFMKVTFILVHCRGISGKLKDNYLLTPSLRFIEKICLHLFAFINSFFFGI
jgi:hypothetical protein